MADSDLNLLSATQAAQEIARGAVSAEDYVRACLDRIAAVEPDVQAFAHLDPDHALAQARALDERRSQGQPLGPLHGVPVALKDIVDTVDYPTECGSPVLTGRRPWQDAPIVSRLRAAGAVILGKTVTTEFAYFHPGKTRNPHDPVRTPGGSSSGSAAAVAAGMVPLAIGSQTNGSIIRPAAFCGAFALKPTHGLVSRAGILALSRNLDHIGPFARSLEDLALLMEVIAGYDPADPDTRPVAAPHFRAAVSEKPALPPRFAFVRTPMWDQAEETTRAALEELAKHVGAREVDLPSAYRAAWDAHRTIMAADMAHNLGAVVDKGGALISHTLGDFVAEGRKVTAVHYLAAINEARRYAAGLAEIFDHDDAIITPAATGVAPLGHSATGNPVFCSLWTLTGLPALSLPLLEDEEGLPLGVQLVGPAGRDERLLRSAQALIDRLGKGSRKSARPRR